MQFSIKEIYRNVFLCEFDSLHSANATVFRLIEVVNDNHKKSLEYNKLIAFYAKNYGNGKMTFYVDTYAFTIHGPNILAFKRKLKAQHRVMNRNERRFFGAIDVLIQDRDINQCYFLTMEGHETSKVFKFCLNHELSHFLYDSNNLYKVEATALLLSDGLKHIKKTYDENVKGYPFDFLLNELIAYSTVRRDFQQLERKLLKQDKL